MFFLKLSHVSPQNPCIDSATRLSGLGPGRRRPSEVRAPEGAAPSVTDFSIISGWVTGKVCVCSDDESHAD